LFVDATDSLRDRTSRRCSYRQVLCPRPVSTELRCPKIQKELLRHQLLRSLFSFLPFPYLSFLKAVLSMYFFKNFPLSSCERLSHRFDITPFFHTTKTRCKNGRAPIAGIKLSDDGFYLIYYKGNKYFSITTGKIKAPIRTISPKVCPFRKYRSIFGTLYNFHLSNPFFCPKREDIAQKKRLFAHLGHFFSFRKKTSV